MELTAPPRKMAKINVLGFYPELVGRLYCTLSVLCPAKGTPSMPSWWARLAHAYL